MANLPVFQDRVTALNAENMNKLTTGITSNENNISTNMDNISWNTMNISSNDYDIANLSTSVKTNMNNISSNDVDIDNLSSLQDDYLLLNGSRAMTGNLLRSGENNQFQLLGGQTDSGAIILYGKDEPSYPGQIRCYATNATKTLSTLASYIEGVTDTPYMVLQHGLKANVISEKTADGGVTIDGCLIKDGIVVNVSDYLLLNGTVAMTGNLDMGGHTVFCPEIKPSGESSDFKTAGGDEAVNTQMRLYGKNHPSMAGKLMFGVPNAAKSTILTVLEIEGVTDNPITNWYYPMKVDTINEKTWAAGVTIDGCLIKDGIVTSAPRDLPFHIKNLSSTEYLLGTGTVNTMYPFNEAVTLTNYVISYDADSNSKIDIELADINGSWHLNSLTQSAAGGYQDNKSFTAKIIGISNKLQIKLDNVSNINYMNFVLNYK